jgi:LysM repeat protein
MARNTEKSMTHALGRRAAQVLLAGAIAATPLALGTGLAHADTDWDELAQCESGGNWNTDTGNGFSGGLQFTPSTWRAFGGSGSPEGASRSEQIAVAERVKAEQGMSAWPTCSKKTGNTDRSANSGSSRSSSDAEDAETDRVDEAAATTPAQPTTTPAAPAANGTHVVAAGDTVGRIAAANGTTAQAVAARNALADPDAITPGQQLAVR